MYSSLLQDVQVRRQMISNAKLLVDWTRGKNLIVSSAAPSVLELRGPNDAANLLSLLGLSNESAKATISKNCRLLVVNALRKKQYYKEAIRVEAMAPGSQTDPKEPWIVDHVDWDPLSSGEGDLVLDDIAKAFAESGKVSQTVKGTDLSNCVDSVESHGLQVKDIGLRTDGRSFTPCNNMGVTLISEDLDFSKKTGDLENVFDSLGNNLLYQQGKPVKHCQQAILPVSSMPPTNVEVIRTSVGSQSELKTSDVPHAVTSPVKKHGLEMQNNIGGHANSVLFSDFTEEVTSKDGCNAGPRNEMLEDCTERLNCSGAQTDDLKVTSGLLSNMDSMISAEMQICIGEDLPHSPNVSMAGNLLEFEEDIVAGEKSIVRVGNVMDSNPFMEIHNSNGLLLGDQQLTEKTDKKKEQNEDYPVVNTGMKEFVVDDTMMLMEPLQQENDSNDISDDLMMGCGKQVQEIGKLKLKHWDSGSVLRFPFKRWLQVQFKKKGRNLKCKNRKRE